MYKGRLASWKVGKNASRKDYLVLARHFADRQSRGFPEGSFEVHNKIRGIDDLRRYLIQHGEKEEAFFAEAVAGTTPTPSYIHYVEPDHDMLAGADETEYILQGTNMAEDRAAESLAVSPSFTEPASGQNPDSHSYRGPAASFEQQNSNVAAVCTVDRASPDTDRTDPTLLCVSAGQYRNARYVGTSAGAATLSDAYDHHTNNLYLQMQIETTSSAAVFSELSNLSSWQSLANVGNNLTCSDASRYAEISLPFVDQMQAGSAFVDESLLSSPLSQISPEDSVLPQSMRQRDDRLVFMSACMLACMYEAAKRNGLQALCLEQAFSAFRRLCVARSPYILTSAITILTWMLVHVEGSFTDDVMGSTNRIASEVLSNNDPICVLLHWMFLATATKLAESPIDSSELRRIQFVFRETHGDYHRHSIVAKYCLAFHLMNVDRLSSADALAEAVDHLSQTEVIATNVLGASDLMTINIVSTLSRAYSRRGDYVSALNAINRSLQAEPLGANHPHRLEIIVRKAVICRKLGRSDEAERLYWIAVRGRIATLGKDHRSTNKAYHSLVTVLTERGRWDSMRDMAHRLLVDPQVAVTEYESWWRRVVDANQGSGRFRASSEESE